MEVQSDRLNIERRQESLSEVRFGGPNWQDLTSVIGPRMKAVWMVYDRQVEAIATQVSAHLGDQGVRLLGLHGLEVDESMKRMDRLEPLYSQMIADGVTRDSWLLAIGGGVLSDFAGYAAASFLRGIDWVAVPTTLLAQVDAAIGGKVAVNLREGKNLIGAFHLPQLVYINPWALQTLPIEGWRTGLGEVVKSALIEGGPLWQSLVAGIPPLGQVDEHWRWVIKTTAKIKVDVVNRDLEETGDRIFLNFGHTLAHALEQMTGYGQWSHGQAVGVGSLYALYLSEKQLGLDPTIRALVTEWLKAWGLPTVLPHLDYAALEPVLLRDKKARVSGLCWVLLQSPGNPKVVRDVPKNLIEEALGALSES
ncbi:MAG: 3-dehydroquinate synthase [Firmicutes bacterium]|nr:3-dehydroquinate synthase [Bacillota bacterium]MCL5064356.1 3-dehydroquinate synthase [Bacillota bacterium]